MIIRPTPLFYVPSTPSNPLMLFSPIGAWVFLAPGQVRALRLHAGDS